MLEFRLPGKNASIVRIPTEFRHHLMTKYPAQSTVIGRWEAGLISDGLMDSRIYFSGMQGYPISVLSVIKVRI